MVDGTPLLDLKPYVPPFDDRPDARIGWFADRLGPLAETRADDRFAPGAGSPETYEHSAEPPDREAIKPGRRPRG